MQQIILEPLGDLQSLGRRWQALEASADGGFYLGWVFLGCQADPRFADARLLSVSQDGQDVALALIGSGQSRAWLNQTGRSSSDSVFIEHNGFLVRRGYEPMIADAARHVIEQTGTLVLSGIDDATLAAARLAGWVDLRQSRFAPCVNLTDLNRPYLETLSANARAQIRRATRHYGPDLRIERAAALPDALTAFHEMVALHQAAWQRRGKPGAFAEPEMLAFHLALIARAWPVGQADLLRVVARGQTVGVLYTFISSGRVLCYQSGFAYDHTNAKAKPGLVCHAMAIAFYAERGMACYDLLAGDDRYKRTLAQSGQMLHWAVLHRPWSLRGLAAIARQTAARAWLRGIASG